MPWVKLDDGFFDHPKAIAAGPMARELNFAAWCWCAANMTDGHIPADVIPLLLAKSGNKRVAVTKLLSVGLWIANGDGYIINDYLEYNPSRAETEERRAQKRAAGQKGAQRRWQLP